MTATSVPRTSVPRRNVLRALAVAVALVGGVTPTWGGAAFAAEPETYTLTIRHLDRNGRTPVKYVTSVTGISGAGADQSVQPHDASGVTTVRLPRGRYLLESALYTDAVANGTDWIVQPRLDLDHDTTVTVDARTTAPVDVRPPDGSATFRLSGMFIEVTHEGVTRMASIVNPKPNLRVAHLGPEAEAGSVKQWFDSYWTTGTGGYALGQTFSGTRALTGLTRQYTAQELATLRIRGGARPGAGGTVAFGLVPTSGQTVGLPLEMAAPGTATFFVTPQRGTWEVSYTTRGAAPNYYVARDIAVRAGATTTQTFDNAVFGPALTGRPGVERDGDRITADIPLLADGDGHVPSAPLFDTAYTSLYRDGVLVGTQSGDARRAEFTVPAGQGSYRLASTVTRKTATGGTTQVNASWTFPSAATSGPTPVPVSVVRFSPELGLTGAAPAGSRIRVPITVQGAAANGRVRSLTVSMSTDGGVSWTGLPVEAGAVTIQNPAAGTGVSLRAELTDTEGNTLDQTLIDAYRTQ
ncbi:serine protease [Streptomyces sp. FH025]|uniref:serine protease n=1 Tax=Streptomyces sp. FH025 TaxID=2815937 RepID=UPI001A9D1BB6|nr:serine protease [Streptomyces sp. FH025]MBO1416511.1 serine protease [Streptomyces sp. FH025]